MSSSSTKVLNVLGFCRAGVGGYDVWQPGAARSLLRREGVLGGATINKMNFLAVLDCLQALVDSNDNDATITSSTLELHSGCVAVAGLLSGDIPRRRPHVRDMCDRIGALALALAPRYPRVRFVYVRSRGPPRKLVGHSRPDKQQQQQQRQQN